jgi:ribosomal protein S3
MKNLQPHLAIGFFEQETGADVQERVVKATKTVKDLGITDINFDNETLFITLRRPGLIIGKKWVTIAKLNQDFKKESNGKIDKIKIIEYK